MCWPHFRPKTVDGAEPGIYLGMFATLDISRPGVDGSLLPFVLDVDCYMFGFLYRMKHDPAPVELI